MCAQLAELCGQRNAIDGQIVDLVAEMDRDELCGLTGARSVKAWVAWKTGITPHNAEIMLAVARRAEEFPYCLDGYARGRLSLDQVGVLAERAADGSDAHYAELAAFATVTQLRTAVKLEPHPDPDPERSITQTRSGRSPRPLLGGRLPAWPCLDPCVPGKRFPAGLSQCHQGGRDGTGSV